MSEVAQRKDTAQCPDQAVVQEWSSAGHLRVAGLRQVVPPLPQLAMRVGGEGGGGEREGRGGEGRGEERVGGEGGEGRGEGWGGEGRGEGGEGRGEGGRREEKGREERERR